jgi:hypothetical protein
MGSVLDITASVLDSIMGLAGEIFDSRSLLGERIG